MGLMRGDPAGAVDAGAHALFFPHGLGHMLGLDVHDMEDLGDIVGYPKGEKRSPQFGLNFLRLARPLETGFVLTVEPGIYVPGLGGIRIEDDVLVTAGGARVLGPGIPRTVAEVEEAMGNR